MEVDDEARGDLVAGKEFEGVGAGFGGLAWMPLEGLAVRDGVLEMVVEEILERKGLGLKEDEVELDAERFSPKLDVEREGPGKEGVGTGEKDKLTLGHAEEEDVISSTGDDEDVVFCGLGGDVSLSRKE